jgi:hypothetical protein
MKMPRRGVKYNRFMRAIGRLFIYLVNPLKSTNALGNNQPPLASHPGRQCAVIRLRRPRRSASRRFPASPRDLWRAPFTGRSNVTNGTPADGIAYAYTNFGCTYFEMYVRDIDEAAYQPGFEAWSSILVNMNFMIVIASTEQMIFADREHHERCAFPNRPGF